MKNQNIEVDESTGAVTKHRVPLSELLEDSTVKRLQDHGYVIRHVGDDDDDDDDRRRVSEPATGETKETTWDQHRP